MQRLHATVAQLQERLRAMEQQRQELLDRRWRRLLIVGGSISLLLHIALLIYLGTVSRAGVGGPHDGEVSVEFAILDSEDLTSADALELDDAVPEVSASQELVQTESDVQLTTSTPAIEVSSIARATIQTLGGSGGAGDGEGMGLGGGGGGGGTSFFGVSAKGRRFAFIVDVSASMGEGGKLGTCMRELARSLESLPDYADFNILLFSTHFIEPPTQKGWMRAKKGAVRQVIRWLGQVEPNGGTQPRSAFMQAFSMSVRPDVVFFLTDGQVQDFTADECMILNERGKRVVINTIAFGDPSSQELLRQIARESGGLYRFVPSGGGP
jgi:hypothetical protein